MNILLISIGAAVAKILGGTFALRFKDKLHLILGFSAGTMLGVAFFDLLPESIGLVSQSYNIPFATTVMAIGFIFFMIVDRVLAHFAPPAEGPEECGHSTHHSGTLGAGALVVHSFLDGIVIGLAYQVSAVVGAIVAVAITIHGFSDGINVTSLILRSGKDKHAIGWIIAGALAPVLGTVSTFLIHPDERILGIILSIFCGSFLYIGASDLLPESHHRHPTPWTTVSTILGLGIIYLAITFIAN